MGEQERLGEKAIQEVAAMQAQAKQKEEMLEVFYRSALQNRHNEKALAEEATALLDSLEGSEAQARRLHADLSSHKAEASARHNETTLFASAASSSLEGIASSVSKFTSAELPALSELLSNCVRAKQEEASSALSHLTAETDGLHLAVMRAVNGMAGSLNEPTQRAEARRVTVTRATVETAARVRDAVDAGAAGLLKGVSQLVERFRQSEQARLYILQFLALAYMFFVFVLMMCSHQSLHDSTAQAAEQLLGNGKAPEEDESAAAMREATKHLELAREALARQRETMEGMSEGLLKQRSNDALRLEALTASVESETSLVCQKGRP